MKYLEEVYGLNWPLNQFAIFGSGPMAVRGIRENNNIDIITTQLRWFGVANLYSVRGPAIQVREHTFVYCTWPGYDDVSKLILDAEIIDDLPFVQLSDVLHYKRLSDQPKDQQDVKLIEEFQETFSIQI